MRYFFTYAILIAAFFFLSTGPAPAALPVPSTAEPSRTQQQIAPAAPPPSAGKVEGAAAQPLKAPPGAETITFTLASLDFTGITVYSKADLLPLYGNRIGHTVSLADIYIIANKLTAKYRNDGYILSQAAVPPQTISSGHVTIHVLEGFINDIKVEGDAHGRLRPLWPYLENVKYARPFNYKMLERDILLINDLPGTTAKAVIVPAPVPGASDIIVTASHKPVDVALEADNRGSRYLGPFQATASARLNNLLGDFEGINIQHSAAPLHNEMSYNDIHVSQPLGYNGTQLTLGGNDTRTRPGFTLSQFDIHGVADKADIAVMHPFIRSQSDNLNATLSFDYLDSYRTDNTGGPTVEDRLSVVRLGSQYQETDSFAGASAISAQVSKGLNIFNSTSSGDPNTSRPGADNTFWKATAEISRLQRLNNQFDFFASGTGQFSPDRLLIPEQFGVGGVNYGSAYDPSEITGDKGVAARAELRMNNAFSLMQLLQPYAFYDIGKIWDPGSTAAADRILSLASTGVGLRLALTKNISGSVELAVPLTRDVATAGNRNPRLFGALTLRF